MPLNLSDTEALGRTYAAARMMAGLDQATLALDAGLSGGTISNVERGKDSKESTLKIIRKALGNRGVVVTFSRKQGVAIVTITFAEDDGDEE